METRELTYFVAVAEELHFRRAAERLGMTQPPLTRAIAQLERRLGVSLLTRRSTGVTLTEAGAVLLRESRLALDAVGAAERRTRRAGRPDGPRLVLVAKTGPAGELLARLLQSYAAEPGALPVDLELCAIGHAARWVRDGRADVALLHLPFDDVSGLDTEELATEPQLAVLPSGHPVAARTSMTVAELHALPDLPAARWPAEDGSYQPGPGPEIHDVSQLLQLVALGRTSTKLPASVTDHLDDAVTTVPLIDAPLVTTLIAWLPRSTSRPVADLVRTAERLRAP